jgi:hypothetical protein
MSDFDLFATRTVGAILISFAVSNWFATPSAGVLAANAFLNAALGMIDVLAITQSTIGANGWSGVILHATLLTATVIVIVHHHRPLRPRD